MNPDQSGYRSGYDSTRTINHMLWLCGAHMHIGDDGRVRTTPGHPDHPGMLTLDAAIAALGGPFYTPAAGPEYVITGPLPDDHPQAPGWSFDHANAHLEIEIVPDPLPFQIDIGDDVDGLEAAWRLNDGYTPFKPRWTITGPPDPRINPNRHGDMFLLIAALVAFGAVLAAIILGLYR